MKKVTPYPSISNNIYIYSHDSSKTDSNCGHDLATQPLFKSFFLAVGSPYLLLCRIKSPFCLLLGQTCFHWSRLGKTSNWLSPLWCSVPRHSPFPVTGYQTVGDTEFTNQEIDYPALYRVDVANLDECQNECSNIPEWLFWRRWRGGWYHQTTGKNANFLMTKHV